MNRETICIKIKQARKESGIKQDFVAEKLNIPISAVSAMESGSRKIDAIELKILSELYGKNIGWFFNENEIQSHKYRNDKLSNEAFTLLEKAPEKIKAATYKAIISFLKEWNLHE